MVPLRTVTIASHLTSAVQVLYSYAESSISRFEHIRVYVYVLHIRRQAVFSDRLSNADVD